MGSSAEEIFARHFSALYPKGVDLAALRAEDANSAENPAILAQLAGAAAAFAKLAPDALGAPELVLDFSDRSVHEVGARLTRELRDAWAPKRDGESDLLVKVTVHGALYVGACIVKNHGGRWLVRRPSWESKIELVSPAGTAELAPFAWWLKSLSDEEIGKGRLGDRYRNHVEVPMFDASTLAAIAPGSRAIPRLAKVRYDTLHKHLRAHLPELREVGDDFPSPERIAEIGFSSLEFILVGDGKMLVMAGAGLEGLHVFWLDKAGFSKAAFFPADPHPSPVVERLPAEGAVPERLRFVFAHQGEARVHETLWWGV